VLTARFGLLPEGVVRQIATCTDLEQLMAASVQVQNLGKPEDLQL
jgi:hypothetical protein